MSGSNSPGIKKKNIDARFESNDGWMKKQKTTRPIRERLR